MKVEAEDVVLFHARLTHGLNACGIEVRIELRLVHVEAGREAHQCSRKQASQQNGSDDGESMPRNFPPQHGQALLFRRRSAGFCVEFLGVTAAA